MKFVVFDTGTGGKLFAKELRGAFPQQEVVEVIDTANSPYGNKSAEEIRELTEGALRGFLQGTEAVVIILACNTATAVCADYLRTKYPHRIIVGFEPMLKPAADLTKTGKVIVLATEATKRSERYSRLRQEYGGGMDIYEPDCNGWAAKIDAGTMQAEDARGALVPYLELGADVIVLACTHYVALEEAIRGFAVNAMVIDPFDAVIEHIKKDIL
ncbi:MAG: glutamate racemase [Candidatus Saccharimonadales bacterium]